MSHYEFYIFIRRNNESLNTLETSKIEHTFDSVGIDSYTSLNDTVQKISLKAFFYIFAQ